MFLKIYFWVRWTYRQQLKLFLKVCVQKLFLPLLFTCCKSVFNDTKVKNFRYGLRSSSNGFQNRLGKQKYTFGLRF